MTWPGQRGVVAILLVLILVPALLLRLESAGDRGHHPSADERAYLAVAAGIRHDGAYASPELRHPFHWAPGTPALFAAADAIGGHQGSARIDRHTARKAQAVVSTLTVLAAFVLAALLAGPWAGLAAAAAVAFYPPMIDATTALVSEPLGALAITAALAAAVWAWQRGGLGRYLLAGAALGLACLVRADVLLAALVVAGVMAVRRRPEGLAVVAAMLVVLVPWSVYASRRAHAFVPITDGADTTLFVATYLPGNGTIFGLKHALYAELVRDKPRYRHVPVQKISSEEYLNAVALRHKNLGRAQAIKKELRRNIRVYVLGHPWAFTKLTVRKVWRMWSAPFRGSYRRTTTATLWLHRVLVLLALAGLIGALWRVRSSALALVAVAVLVIAVVDVAFVAEARHAFRLMGAVLAAGAAGWAMLLTRRAPAT